MSTTPTQLSVPSETPQDLKFNAGKIDEFVTSMGWTYTDRFGDKHYTIEGINYLAQQVMSAFGYVTLTGVTFDTGATLNNPNEVLFNPADDSYYKWTGSFAGGPKVVPANSTPESSGGVGPGKWLNVGDTQLRSDLNNDNDGLGDALIAVKQPITDWPGRTQHDRNSDYKNAKDAGAVGDGVTDDTAALQRYISYLETLPTVLTYPYTPSDMDIPPGDYGISKPLIVTQPIRIRGKGVRIKALGSFTATSVQLQTGGTESFKGMFLFVNGKKGADSGQGQLRFGVEIDSGITIDCQDIAYPNIYIERFAYSKINCVMQSSVHDGLVIGPSMWGLSARGANIENFADSAIRFLERSAANGSSLDVIIWGNFKTGNAGILFDSESDCNGVVVSGFIEKVNYGIIAGRGTGPVNAVGVDFEQCQLNVIRAASDMSDGRKVGPITLSNCFLHSVSGSKIYAEGSTVVVNDSRLLAGTYDFETDAGKTGLILFDNNQFESGAIGIASGANVRGKYTHQAGDAIYNYATNALETFANTYEMNNFEWTGYPLTQTSGFTFSARASTADNRNYGRSTWFVSDRTSTDVQTVTGVTLATDNAVRYFGPMADNLITCGSASARFTVVYAVAGTINTSDVREKQQQRLLYDAEKKAAAEIKSSIRAYKRNDEVERDGDDAKWHFGVMAQGVAEVLKKNGLNHEDYDFLSYEEWDDIPESVDKEGNVISPVIPAGSRWGVKYSQLLCFIISVS
ncbi:glycosyl hydrolase family 28-related protein [Citrobacter werkmanii]|uniref:tail fiber/spike domain-containing protein n=1 Tax=Citrobacter werkmanii TaxID=67827 RepID=UPI00311D355B